MTTETAIHVLTFVEIIAIILLVLTASVAAQLAVITADND